MAESSEFLFYTTVDDELYDELLNLVTEQVVLASVWDDSLAEALQSRIGAASVTAVDGEANETNDELTFDVDLYLAGGVYFELYGVNLYGDPDSPPLRGMEEAQARLQELVRGGATLGDVAVDEEDSLVLILYLGSRPAFYLDVGGFVLEEWDELPV